MNNKPQNESKNTYSLQIKNIRCPIDSQLINYKEKTFISRGFNKIII